MATDDPGFGVYVHWPFCERICPYCDFNVHTAREINEAAWHDALIAELAHYAADLPDRTVTSIYFGGGTPSLMPPETIRTLIDSVASHWSTADDPEITLETNPTSSERARLEEFKAAGINRLSIGVQSFDDVALAFLGRDHSGADAIRTLEAARATFDRVTFDLIYARPGQSRNDWQRELAQALRYAGGHISLYQLTIESGTPFFREHVEVPDDDITADMFEATQAVLTEAGMPAYEISNHARPGEESRHNLTCWRGGDYLGIGPGAHGRLTVDGAFFGTHQIHNPTRWLKLTRERGHGTAKRRPLTADDRARELIMMGMRLVEGIALDRFTNTSGTEFDAVVDAAALERLVEGGLLERDHGQVRATAAGRQRLNALLTALLK
ncbi:MAG: coproporphyrinogen III oxidase [Rhodospirillales bacterium]|nr:coproporphyrinogen III oxidase [Rhodospirillales bacterium]MBO6787591.1 coproporphyrinogen III oxidase [Rhodospirillales bacterium]